MRLRPGLRLWSTVLYQELVGVMRSIGQNPTEDEILELVLGKSFSYYVLNLFN
jgi:hypothetical protein